MSNFLDRWEAWNERVARENAVRWERLRASHDPATSAWMLTIVAGLAGGVVLILLASP